MIMSWFCQCASLIGPCTPLIMAWHAVKGTPEGVTASGSTPMLQDGASWIHSAETRCAVCPAGQPAGDSAEVNDAPVVTSVRVSWNVLPLSQLTLPVIVSPGLTVMDVM